MQDIRPLADSWHKLERGREHAAALKANIATWGPNQPSGPSLPIRKIRTDNDHFVFKVGYAQELPLDWSLQLGDALTNLRAALDYVAHVLVEHGTSKPENGSKEERAISFPICISEENFTDNTGNRLPGVSPEFLAVIGRYQPYVRGDKANHHPLALLDYFVRRDKHRRLQLGVFFLGGFAAEVASTTNFSVDTIEPGKDLKIGMAMKSGSELIQISGHANSEAGQPDVNVTMHIGFGVTLPETPYGMAEVLDEILGIITVLLGELDQMLVSPTNQPDIIWSA